MTNGSSPRQRPAVILAVLSLGGISYALLQSLVLPALPEIQRSLHVSEASASWVLTAYLLSASVGTPIIGRLGDMYGKQRVLIFVLAMLAAGTLVSALASSLGLLLAGRVIQGAGGGIFPLAFSIVRDEFPEDRVAGGIGLISSLLGGGAGAGVVLAGVVVGHLSYHWLFWIPLVAILGAALATHLLVPESPVRASGRVNWLAGALMSAGLIAVLLAVTETTAWGWASARTVGLLGGGLVVLAAWVAVEVRSPHPLVDMRMMRIRGVWTTNLVALLVGVGMYSAFILLPQFVQEPTRTGYGFGATVIEAGLFLAPSTVAMVLVGQLAGRLEHRFGSRPPLLAGAAFAAGSFVLLLAARSQAWEIYVASALLGIGIGLAFAALANLIVENVAQDQTGVATGMNTVMRTLGGAFGAQVAATLLAGNRGAAGLPSDHGYTLAFAMCAGALVVGLVVGFAIPGRRGTPVAASRPAPSPRPGRAAGVAEARGEA